ncbi:MAG: MerR family transcriptional regulator [Bacteroidota bacterium]
MKEISEELHINYKKVLNYKNQLANFMPGISDGRNMRYYPECIELFQIVSALRSEGYTFAMIRDVLREKHSIHNNSSLNQWVTDWIKNHRTYPETVHNPPCPSYDQSGPVKTSQNQSGPITTDNNQFEPAETSPDQSNLDSPNHSPSESGTTSFDQGSESLLSDPDDFLTDQEKFENKLSEFKAELLAEISAQVDQQLEEKVNYEFKTLAGRLEKHLSELQVQLNGSLTQFYKAIVNVQEGLMSLNSRLSGLEADLDTGRNNQELDLYEIDLEVVQIKTQEIILSKDYIKHENAGNLKNKDNNYSENNPMSAAAQEQENQNNDPPGHGQDQANTSRHADIEYVRNSIVEGKPDKKAVIEWIQNEKYLDPSQSYGDLANKLNEAGIPTLRGRNTWCRSVVRGLVVKR